MKIPKKIYADIFRMNREAVLAHYLEMRDKEKISRCTICQKVIDANFRLEVRTRTDEDAEVLVRNLKSNTITVLESITSIPRGCDRRKLTIAMQNLARSLDEGRRTRTAVLRKQAKSRKK